MSLYTSLSDYIERGKRLIPMQDMRISSEAPDREAALCAFDAHADAVRAEHQREKERKRRENRFAIDPLVHADWQRQQQEYERQQVIEARRQRITGGTATGGAVLLKTADQLDAERQARELARQQTHRPPVGTMVVAYHPMLAASFLPYY